MLWNKDAGHLGLLRDGDGRRVGHRRHRGRWHHQRRHC